MKFGAKSDKGLIREINEDSYNLIAGYPGIPTAFIIADGMGGHTSGEVASKIAVDSTSNHILENASTINECVDISPYICEMMKKVNSDVYLVSQQQKELHGMGTTLIVTIIHNGSAFIGHIGDSRVYLIKDRKINQLTTDHSYIEELIKNGTLTREEAKINPKKNVLTRALGCSEDIEIDSFSCGIEKDDILVMCTDGLTNMVNDDEILSIILEVGDLENACIELIKKANENGGGDNVTVILFKND